MSPCLSFWTNVRTKCCLIKIIFDPETTCLPNFCCTVFFDFLWGWYERTRKSFDIPDFRKAKTLWLGPSALSSCQSIQTQLWKQISPEPWEEPWLWTLGWMMFLIEVLDLRSSVGQLPRDLHFLACSLSALCGGRECQESRLLCLLYFWKLSWCERINPLTSIILTEYVPETLTWSFLAAPISQCRALL